MTNKSRFVGMTKSKRRRVARRKAEKNVELFLPREMWEQIMIFLSPTDLCNLALVSKYINSISTQTQLWQNISINHLSKSKLSNEGLASLFTAPRFSRIKVLDLSVVRSVGASLFRLPTNECISLFEYILTAANHKTLTINNLNLRHENLKGVDAKILAEAVSHLEIVDLSYTRLTSEQSRVLCQETFLSRSLKELRLVSVVLTQVYPWLIARAVAKLEKVDLSWTRLTTDQCTEIFQKSLSSATLQDLNMVGVNLSTDISQVPIDLLARAVSHLRRVNLSSAKATSEQYEGLLKYSLSSKTLQDINLESGSLAKVPAHLLASAVSRLEKVDLSCTLLETDQCVALLSRSITSKTLTHVNLDNVNLSGVEVGLLASAVSRFRSVDLSATKLSTEQCVALLKSSVASKSLVDMTLHFVELTDVPEDVVEKAREKFCI